jgi:predicted  nucleic acid-binding Zn-ribbon protein
MHEQMMKDMQGDLDSMRSNLQKMKDQVGKVSDRETRNQLQLNIDMWQSFVDHMDKHMDAMKQMTSAHHGPPDDAGKHEHQHAPATPKQ